MKVKKILVPALPGTGTRNGWVVAQPGHRSWICLYAQFYSWLEPGICSRLLMDPLGCPRHFHKFLSDFCQPQVAGQGQLLVQLEKDNDKGSIILQIPAITSASTKWRTGEVLAKPWILQPRCGEVGTNWTALEVFIFFKKKESFLLTACEIVPGDWLEGWGRSTRSFLRRF